MAVFAGQTIKASLLDRLERPPTAELIQTVGQSVPNGTWGIITFDSEVEDSHGGHSTVTNTSRYTCMVAGKYRVVTRSSFVANATGSRGARVHLNGSFIQGAANLVGAGSLSGIVECSHTIRLVPGDYLEAAAGHNSGGALSTYYGGEAASKMYVDWISA